VPKSHCAQINQLAEPAKGAIKQVLPEGQWKTVHADYQRCHEFIRLWSGCGAFADQSQATQVDHRQVDLDHPGRMDIDRLWKVDFGRSAEIHFDQLARVDFDSTNRVKLLLGS